MKMSNIGESWKKQKEKDMSRIKKVWKAEKLKNQMEASTSQHFQEQEMETETESEDEYVEKTSKPKKGRRV